MKILIDARFFGPSGTGIGKYVEKLVEGLEIVDQENNYFILLRRENFDLFEPKNERFKKVLADARWYSAKEQILLPKIIFRLKPDLVHFPHYNVPFFVPAKFVVTIYDLTKWEFGKDASNVENNFVYFIKQNLFRLLFKRALYSSEKIISGSETTKEKLVNLFRTPPSKIQTIYAGADDFLDLNNSSTEDRVEVLEKLKVDKPFFLYVGNAAPYKNVDVILRTLKKLDKNIKFVYVSSRDDFVEKLLQKAEDLGVQNRIIATGYIDNRELSILYQDALCYIFPSLSEGFGLPGLEAMASSCPVVCSDIPVLREVYSDAALFFESEDENDLKNKIFELSESKNLREELIKKGLSQVKKYSWDKLAQETLKVYKEIIYSRNFK